MKGKRAFKRISLMVDKNAWLDRGANRTALDHSKIVRALVAAFRASGLDLARFESEQDLAVIATCGLRSAASQFPGYRLPKREPGGVDQRYIP